MRDIHATLRAYVESAGIGPWACFTYGPSSIPRLEYLGAPGTFSMHIALSTTEPQIELIQPLDGPSIYHDWMAVHGEGVHHLAYLVDSIDDGIAEMERLDYRMIQFGAGFGVRGDGAFAYFDTEADLATIVELRELPKVRRDPDWTVELPSRVEGRP